MEPVLVCGHSQGGMVATALAAGVPEDVGLDIRGVLTLGSPTRRYSIRDDVTMVSVVHDQDVVPSTDGTPQRVRDHRVSVGRRLVRPRQGALYYAHSSSTYTETVRQVERKTQVAPWGRVPEAVQRLQEFLPHADEPTRVTIAEIWQDVLEPERRNRWDTYISLDRADWEPADYDEDWSPAPLVALPAVELPDLSALQDRATHVVEEWTQGVATVREDLRSAVDETLHRLIPGGAGGSGGPGGAGGVGRPGEEDKDEGGHALVGEGTDEGNNERAAGPLEGHDAARGETP